MAEKLVRTQAYLPQAAYRELKARARLQGFALGVQIREALVDYLFRLNPRLGSNEAPPPFDLGALNAVIALPEGQGATDAAENHDQYIYGDPHGDGIAPRLAAQREETPPAGRMLRDASAEYRVRRRKARRSKGADR